MLTRHMQLARVLLVLSCAWAGCDDTASSPPGPERDAGGRAEDTGRRPVADTTPSVTDVATPQDTAITPPPDATPVDDTAPIDVTPTPDVAPPPDSGPVGEPGGFFGTVWAPGNAPGMVPSGHEIPVAGALVYLTTTAPPAIPQRAYCAACQTPPARAVITDAAGRFELRGFVAGTYQLVVEKGQFRRQVEVEVTASGFVELPIEHTTLPSRNAPSEGMYTPRIAMAVGASDHLEDILGKMQLGNTDASGRFVPESADGIVDLYSNGGNDGGLAIGTLESLVRDPARLAEYHILFIPCSGDENARALQDQTVLRNLREYVASGGNLYVTDWSGEWHDNVFPAQIELGGGAFDFFGDGVDTPASAYNAATNTWNTSQFGNADGDSYDTPNAEVVDTEMRDWLAAQGGPLPGGGTSTRYNATNFTITGNWNFIANVHDVVVGRTSLGEDIVDRPRVWVIGGQDFRPTPKRPMTVSYEPAGCGRVVFSTYHTTDGVHLGLVPQERILLYLIMEIGTCRNPKE